MKKAIVLVMIALVLFTGCGLIALLPPPEDETQTSSAESAPDSEELTALNLVKEYIAGDDDSVFEPLSTFEGGLAYKFKDSNYVIQYDGMVDDRVHLIHEYEVVIDDPATGEGHTVTSNWYEVDLETKTIIPMFNQDGSYNENY